MELKIYIFSRTLRLTNAPTAYKVSAQTDQNNVLMKQGRKPDTLSVMLKMEKEREIEVVDVGDNAESRVIDRREEERLVDEDIEIFDTVLLSKTIEIGSP